MKFLLVVLASFIFLQCVAGQKKPSAAKLKLFKEFLDKAKAKLTSSQEDAEFDGNLMRVDKKGGRIIVVRKMKLLDIRVKGIVEKFSNETEVEKVVLKEVICTKSKNVNQEDSRYNVKSVSIALMCTLPNAAEVTFEMFMFKADGNVTGDDGNIYEVASGAVKINIEITKWPRKAEVIDVTFGMGCGLSVLKGSKPAKLAKKLGRRVSNAVKRRAPESFNVCPEARGTFASNFKSDGNDVDMPEGYPKANNELPDNEAEITLRFNGTTIVYDPVMEVGEDIEEEGDAGKSNAVATTPSMLLMFAAVLTFIQSKIF